MHTGWLIPLDVELCNLADCGTGSGATSYTFRAALLIVPVHLDNVPPATTIRAVVQRTTIVLVHLETVPPATTFRAALLIVPVH